MAINWNQQQPAPTVFWQLVHEQFPVTRNLGIYNPGHEDHGEGRALDIGLLVSKPEENEIAWGLINDVLKPHQAEIGWSYFIWHKWIWYPKSGQQEGGFKGDHTNHIHVSWSQATSQNNMFQTAGTAMAGLVSKLEIVNSLKGWWRVLEDGEYYYYFVGSGGAVQYTKAAPSSTSAPPLRADNKGTYKFTPPDTLVITWNRVAGAEAACQETFYNAVRGCQQMNANSNLYSPLLATRQMA